MAPSKAIVPHKQRSWQDYLNNTADVVAQYAKVRTHRGMHSTDLYLTVFQVLTISRVWQPVVHWGFIPAIIILGIATTEPKPTLAQLLSPM